MTKLWSIRNNRHKSSSPDQLPQYHRNGGWVYWQNGNVNTGSPLYPSNYARVSLIITRPVNDVRWGVHTRGDIFWSGVVTQVEKHVKTNVWWTKWVVLEQSIGPSLSQNSSLVARLSAIGYMSARVLNNNPSNDSLATATGAVDVWRNTWYTQHTIPWSFIVCDPLYYVITLIKNHGQCKNLEAIWFL